MIKPANLVDMTIALAGPIELAAFQGLIPDEVLEKAPKGLGGSPVNLLARELINRGYKLLIVSLDPAVEKEVLIKGERVKIFIGPFRRKRARDVFAKETEFIRQILQREAPDFVHAHWVYEYALGALATTIPHLVTAHDAPFNVLRLDFSPYRIIRTYMVFRALRRVRNLTAVAPYVASHLRRFLGYRRHIEVIPNGMPAILFEGDGAKRAASPLTFATILVGWSGRKNGERAIEAFDEVRKRWGNARLLMFGGGHGPGEAAYRWAAQRGLSEGIEFVGQVSHGELLARLKEEVDVVVHPALEEAQPMALIEPMAMGIPVIAGERSGGVPWTLEDGQAGMLVDVRSAKMIATAMAKLADDKDERYRIGESGREAARRRFHIAVVTDAYLQAYANALSKENASACASSAE